VRLTYGTVHLRTVKHPISERDARSWGECDPPPGEARSRRAECTPPPPRGRMSSETETKTRGLNDMLENWCVAVGCSARLHGSVARLTRADTVLRSTLYVTGMSTGAWLSCTHARTQWASPSPSCLLATAVSVSVSLVRRCGLASCVAVSERHGVSSTPTSATRPARYVPAHVLVDCTLSEGAVPSDMTPPWALVPDVVTGPTRNSHADSEPTRKRLAAPHTQISLCPLYLHLCVPPLLLQLRSQAPSACITTEESNHLQ